MKNSWNRPRWGARLIAVTALLLALVVSASPSAAQAGSTVCATTSGPISALFLVDGSTSLALTDPDAQLAAGVHDAITVLRDTAATQDRAIDVSLVTYGVDYKAVLPWTPLTPDSGAAFDEAIGELATTRNAIDTDYANALRGAQADFAERASAGHCSLIVVATDGGYAIDARSEASAAEFGLTKPYAPDARLDEPGQTDVAISEGTATICEAGGIIDELRSANVALSTVAISTALRGNDQAFLAGLSASDGETTCGQEPGRGSAHVAGSADEARSMISGVVGEFAGADDVQTSTVTVCQLVACPQGEASIDVAPGIGRFATTAGFDAAAKTLHLTAPDGSTAIFTPEGDTTASLGAADITATFSAASAVVTATATDTMLAPGEWTLTVVNSAGVAFGGAAPTATITTAQQSGIAVLLTDVSAAVAGETLSISASLVDVAGRPLAAETLGGVAAVATLADDASGALTTIELTGDTILSGSGQVPADFSGTGTLTVEASGSLDGVVVTSSTSTVVSADTGAGTPASGTEASGTDDNGVLRFLPFLLLLGSLGVIGIAVLWVRANRRSMFGLDDVRIAEIPVVVRADNRIDRIETPTTTRQLYIRGSDFAAIGRGRSRTFAGGRLRFIGNLSMAPKAPVYGVAIGNEPVVGPMGTEEIEDKIGGVLATSLAGQWLFEIDSKKTADSAGEDDAEIFGRLVVFVEASLDDSSHHFATLATDVATAARELAGRAGRAGNEQADDFADVLHVDTAANDSDTALSDG